MSDNVTDIFKKKQTMNAILQSYANAFKSLLAGAENLRVIMVKNGDKHVSDGILRACLGVACTIAKAHGFKLRDVVNVLKNEVWPSIDLKETAEEKKEGGEETPTSNEGGSTPPPASA